MTVLRSRDNARVRHWQKLTRDARYRREEQRALLEGAHLLEAFLAAGGRPEAVLATEQALRKPEIDELVGRAGAPPILLAENVFQAVVDAQHPPGLAAEVRIPSPRRLAAGEGPWVFLEGIQDAGNVGTIVRTAAAFGAATVVLDRACAEPWSPKVLRSGMGGHFLLDLVQTEDLEAVLRTFGEQGGKLICTLPHDGKALKEADLSGRLGWIFGGEGPGVSPGAARLAALRVRIPMAPGSESLNVAAAAAVCLYEAFSRRGGGS